MAYALQATPFDKRNVTQVDARMYVNLPDQTPSDAIVYTYDKEEYDIFSKQKKECIYDKVSGKIEGDILRFGWIKVRQLCVLFFRTVAVIILLLKYCRSSVYASVYIEIEYNCEEETNQKAVSVTALNLIEN